MDYYTPAKTLLNPVFALTGTVLISSKLGFEVGIGMLFLAIYVRFKVVTEFLDRFGDIENGA